jgi:hypothetical protein
VGQFIRHSRLFSFVPYPTPSQRTRPWSVAAPLIPAQFSGVVASSRAAWTLVIWRCDTTASNLFIESKLTDSGVIFPSASIPRLHLAHTSPYQVCFLCQLFVHDGHGSSNCPGAARHKLQRCLIVAHEERDRSFDIDISGQFSDDFAVLLPSSCSE